MATIANATLSLAHDKTKKTVNSVVRCTVNFTALELCQMKNCKDVRLFKLKCQLWGEDSGLNFGDDFLFTYTTVFFFPDPSPTGSETRTFEVVLGEGVLDEDWGQDEVYGKLILTNLYTLVAVTKKTNVVHHSF
jgi:hypothetical protein